MTRSSMRALSRRTWRRGARRGAIACAAVLLIASGSAVAAPDSAETSGIDEHLGAAVPLDLALRDETGASVTLRQLIDKPTILTLNYFRCGGICTPQLNNLVRTLNEISIEPGKDFQVLTVSFDPADTPAIAAEKRTNYFKLIKRPFPPLAWRFLTGDAAATGALARAVGFGFQKQGDAFIHPGALIVLSAAGKVTQYLYGISYLPAEVQMAVDDAARGVVRPSISRTLSFCYSYDPEGRKYVLNITRVAGTATLACAVVLVAVVLFIGRSRGRTERASS